VRTAIFFLALAVGNILIEGLHPEYVRALVFFFFMFLIMDAYALSKGGL